MSFLDALRRVSDNINQLTCIDTDSPHFLAHAILAADLAVQANSAKTIDEVHDVQRKAVEAILYSPLGTSLQTEALYMSISKCCVFRMGKMLEGNEYMESGMYTNFKKNPQKYIPGSKIIKRKTIKGSVPDFFLEVDSVFSIAEFKAEPFKKRHLFQLQEYVETYEAQRGYAVAPSLACQLPSNISFVRMSAHKSLSNRKPSLRVVRPASEVE